MNVSTANRTWVFSTIHNTPCRIIEEQSLWGQAVCRVWLPNQDAVVRVPRSALQPLDTELDPETEASRIGYVAAAAKVADILEGSAHGSDENLLLAPMESNVIPLPHQIRALTRAISGDRVRYFLADEVGLGKTIEAGLIMRELKLRGLVRRTLVVAPKGIATQWVSEMDTHFNETFQMILGEDLQTLRRISSTKVPANPFSQFSQVVVPQDTYKPLDGKYGEAARYRFGDLVTAGWDLVVVDEAHRLGGSTDQVARYKLGRGLAEAAPYMLLLSATPHQGKTDAFHRLMNLIDSEAFPDEESVSRQRVAPYVIRTEKRKAIDADGKPLFKPRRTEMAPVRWEARHHLQRLLYEAVTDYVREGYNQALKEKKRHIGFLMILMQRLVISSTRAIRTTLERRLEVLNSGLRAAGSEIEKLENRDSETDTLYDMDGQQLLDELLNSRVSALQNEAEHVKTLLDAARKSEQAGPDAKAEGLIEWIYRLQAEENEPDLKVLIFTEFVPTQTMLKEFLEARGISVATLNGSMNMEERKQAQENFQGHARVLVSTDAGGEGLNLQFCHVIINYDIPWNPMRLEQRIGRVDRIGQPKTVRAINFVFEESVEFRVRQVLEEKLSVIFEQFGIDKTGDVLDSAQAGELFEDVFASAIIDPDSIESSVDNTVSMLRDEISRTRQSSAVYGLSEEPDTQIAERLRSHPLPDWVEKMTVSYLSSLSDKENKGAGAKLLGRQSAGNIWELTWPDGTVEKGSFTHFSSRTTHFNLSNSRIRGLALNLPQVVEARPIPCVSINGLPADVSGLWGLFEIRVQAGQRQKITSLRIPLTRRGYISVFISDEGRLFLPTARHIWDTIQTAKIDVIRTLSREESASAFKQLMQSAENAGKEMFEALAQEYADALAKEEERGRVAFNARRKAIEKVGLPEVRQYRMVRCDAEEAQWKKELAAASQTVPEIRPLLLTRIVKGVENA
jgi:superfamily II DNA or RNA helicase